MKKIFIRLGLFSLTLYLVFALLIGWNQEKFLFYPEKVAADEKLAFGGLRADEFFIDRENGIRIQCVHFHADSSKGVVLFFHGNGGSIRSWGSRALDFISRGWDCVMMDYRGYGKSSGEPENEKQMMEDAEAVSAGVTKENAGKPVIVMGVSLGTGIAAQLATRHTFRNVILEGAYTCIADLASERMWMLPVGLLLRYRFETIRHLRNLKSPVTLIHGDQDEVIPYSHALQLKETGGEQVSLITLPGGNHNGIHSLPAYQSALDSLLK